MIIGISLLISTSSFAAHTDTGCEQVVKSVVASLIEGALNKSVKASEVQVSELTGYEYSASAKVHGKPFIYVVTRDNDSCQIIHLCEADKDHDEVCADH